ncbi:MAG: hypothetical protein ACREDR_43170 [Blastocatellia bacterium]
MNQTSTAGMALHSLLKSAISRSNGQVCVWLYTSFGVIRGAAEQETGGEFIEENVQADIASGEIIVVKDATVEHYSSHLPTASFTRLYVRLEDVMGFALDDEARQS